MLTRVCGQEHRRRRARAGEGGCWVRYIRARGGGEVDVQDVSWDGGIEDLVFGAGGGEREELLGRGRREGKLLATGWW